MAWLLPLAVVLIGLAGLVRARGNAAFYLLLVGTLLAGVVLILALVR